MEYKSEMQGFYCPESIPMPWGEGRAGYVLDFLVLKRYKSRNFEKISVVVLYPILIHTLGKGLEISPIPMYEGEYIHIP